MCSGMIYTESVSEGWGNAQSTDPLRGINKVSLSKQNFPSLHKCILIYNLRWVNNGREPFAPQLFGRKSKIKEPLSS